MEFFLKNGIMEMEFIKNGIHASPFNFVKPWGKVFSYFIDKVISSKEKSSYFLLELFQQKKTSVSFSQRKVFRFQKQSQSITRPLSVKNYFCFIYRFSSNSFKTTK